jgi:hypothetical protein
MTAVVVAVMGLRVRWSVRAPSRKKPTPQGRL